MIDLQVKNKAAYVSKEPLAEPGTWVCGVDGILCHLHGTLMTLSIDPVDVHRRKYTHRRSLLVPFFHVRHLNIFVSNAKRSEVATRVSSSIGNGQEAY